MAGKYGPASAWLLIDGYDFTASKVKGISHKRISPQEDTTGLGDSFRERCPVGVQDTEFTQTGAVWSTAALNSHDALVGSEPSTPQTAARVFSTGFSGHTIGEHFFGAAELIEGDVDVLSAEGQLQKVNVSHVISGQGDLGVVLHALATITADADTESSGVDHADSTRLSAITSSSVANPSVITTTVAHGIEDGALVEIASHSGSTPSIDGEHVATVTSTTTFTIPVNVTVGGTGGTVQQVNSLSGGAGYQHVTAESGFSAYVGKVRDSLDDITYADLVTFVDAPTAPDGQRVEVSGTVDRYLAAELDVTGTGSITAFIGFART